MSTGSIQNPAVKVFENYDDHRLHMSAVNDSGGNLVPGMEVIFKSNGTIDKRNAGTDIPVGIVMIGAENGKRATVRLYATALINAVATGGNMNAGVFVVPNGNIDGTYGTPEVVAAGVSDWVSMIVVKGANQDLPIKVAVLNAPHQLNPAP